MFFTFLLLPAVFYFTNATYSSCVSNSLKPSIFRAMEANIENYPYQVSVRILQKHWCGGALIDIQTVVTTASCLDGVEPSVLTIGASTSSTITDGITLQVIELIRHPQFNRVTKDYDVAIIKVRTDYTTVSERFNYVRPIEKEINKWAFGIATGWGKTTAGYIGYSEVLRQDYIPILPQNECKNQYKEDITDRMLCAGYSESQVDSCVSDRGSPLVYNGTLIGLASWGNGCGRPNKPVVYTNIVKVLPFLKQNQ